MKVTIEFSGPPASGKTLLSEFIQRQLGSHFGFPSELTRGSQANGPKNDRLVVTVNPEMLDKVANFK